MGKDAVRAYKEALNEGSRPIPYYSMLILGEERVGKTSLYRQLVGKEFIQGLDPTRGIENNTVETVDIKVIDLKKSQEWKEVHSDSSDALTKAITDEAIKRMPIIKEKVPKTFTPRADKVLLSRVKELEKQMTPPTPKVQVQVRIEPKVTSNPYSKVFTDYGPPAQSKHPSQNVENPQPLLLDQRSRGREIPEAKNTKPNANPTPTPVAAAYQEPPVLPKPRQTVPPVRKELKNKEISKEKEPIQKPEGQGKQRASEPGIVNRRQGVLMAKSMKKRITVESGPELTLSTFDFAGQQEYRPMHHCFITRRAFYLVVFNAIDMAKNSAEDNGVNKHLEEVRYWVHSINAHVFSLDSDGNDGDETVTKVILVGTHSKGCNEEELKSIDKLLDGLRDDDRCVNHLFKLKTIKLMYNNFIPVENSCDSASCGGDYLRESHTHDVQESIKTLYKKLPYLKEDYPIKWLNFMEHIERLQSTSPVVTMDDLVTTARQLNIENPKVAIKFLHKSSKIICLG